MQILGKANDWAGTLIPGKLAKDSEGFEGKHIFPTDTFMDGKEKKLDQNMGLAFPLPGLLPGYYRRKPHKVIQNAVCQLPCIFIYHLQPSKGIAGQGR